MKLSVIVAMSRNRVIGRGGQLPWRLSADLRRFKRITMGSPMIMGRRTWESIGRPLPGRKSIVLTQQLAYHAAGASVASDLDEALRLAAGASEVFVIGGATLYEIALGRVERIYLTLVEAEVEGDAFFPDVDLSKWHLTQDEPYAADDKNELPFRFQLYERPL